MHGATVKKKKIILRIFRQPLHVSGVSRLIIRRYNRMKATIGTCYSGARWYTAEAATIGVAASEAALVAAGTADCDFVATVVVAAAYIVVALTANDAAAAAVLVPCF
jgi:hypothetical protein